MQFNLKQSYRLLLRFIVILTFSLPQTADDLSKMGLTAIETEKR